MNRFIYLCIILVIFSFTAESAQNEQPNIDLQTHSDKKPEIFVTYKELIAINSSDVAIFLSDGSKWKLKEKKETYEEISYNWKNDDEIRLGILKDTDHFIMKNMRTKSSYLVDLVCDSSIGSLIKKIDKNGYTFRTEGGLLWAVGYWGSFGSYKWSPGDRVLINKSTYQNSEDYMIINSRDATYVWASMVIWK